MMDFLILLAARRVLACSATYARLLLGAAVGACGVCLFLLVPLPAPAKLFLFYLPVTLCMVVLGLDVQEKSAVLRAFLLVYLVSFLLGGIMTWLRPYLGGYLRIGSLFFALTAVSYFLLTRGMDFLRLLWNMRERNCRVTLYFGEKSCTVPAILDSGNLLTDPLTGKPVHILCRDAMRRLADADTPVRARYIPYTTIQKENGVLPVITIDRLVMHRAGYADRRIEAPLIGISGQSRFAGGTYEMIIHPDGD